MVEFLPALAGLAAFSATLLMMWLVYRTQQKYLKSKKAPLTGKYAPAMRVLSTDRTTKIK